jgi:23S rRNA (cytidine1920-2'-O)/16S rRNA (cytidine1409-2'-O)-methyltransferase
VIAGDVQRGGHGERASKPGQMVTDNVTVDLAERPPFVSRGGVKLRNALDALGIEVAGRHCLDAGASTGGFTDCLLQRGAAGVIALDVAYGELDLRLREDPRVAVVERTNARTVDPAALPWRADLVVADLSFISLRKALPAVLGAADPKRFDCLALVKPQFEVGRERVGRGGVVRDGALRREALVAVGEHVRGELSHAVMGYASSGLPGPAGNRETFVWIAEAGRAGAAGDLEAAAREVER